MDFYINISRLHPLLVHLPIGILMLAFIMEALNWWNKNQDFDKGIRLSLIVGVVSSLGAVLTGLLLFEEGGYDENLLTQHKWMGISLTVLTMLLLVANYYKPSIKRLYNSTFIVVVVLLSVTGHIGGSLTHGTDYLFSKPVDVSIKVANINEQLAYKTVINPIIQNKCNGCHNLSKTKGDLIMTTYEGLLAGGEHGSILSFDQPTKSELIKRVLLPESDDAHMPPKGKRQLTENEIKLMQWWLNNQACDDCLVESMSGNEAVAEILATYNQTDLQMNAINIDPVDPDAIAEFVHHGINVYAESESSPFVMVNISGRQDLSKQVINELSEIAENIIELNISNSNFSDEMAHDLDEFTYLRKLQIQNTLISNQTISSLLNLKYLESLNLYGTKVTDDVIPVLEKLSSLKRLYLWQTDIQPDAINNLTLARPLLAVAYQLDDEIFGGVQLKSPLIESESSYFSDSVLITLQSGLKNSTVFYTTDGEQPDTTSMIYSQPFYITESLVLKTIVHKEGWQGSPIGEEQFIKAGYEVAKATFLTQPSEKYGANGVQSLVDLKKGSQSFIDGQWLGYEGEHMEVQLFMKKPSELAEVHVGSLAAQGNWIFHPIGIEIWTSLDGEEYDRSGHLEIPLKEAVIPTEIKSFHVTFDPVTARYVKIKALNQLTNPEWHPGAGGKSWIFIDEIILN